MPIVLADGVSTLFRSLWPLIAPTIGGLGAFIRKQYHQQYAIFVFQFSMAQKIGATEHIVVALQAVGAAEYDMRPQCGLRIGDSLGKRVVIRKRLLR